MKTIKVLFLSNSFGDDTIEYMPQITKELGINVDIYNLYIGGCSINTHIDNLINDKKLYSLRSFNKEKEVWETTDETSSKQFIASIPWNYLVLQQSSYYSGLENGLDGIQDLLDLIKPLLLNKKTKFIWNMTWAYPKHSDLEIFEQAFQKDQKKMYQAILDNVKKDVVPNKEFSLIIPNGTALMYAREHVSDTLLHRDGFHLSFDYGRFLAGLTATRTIFNIDISGVKYRPENTSKDICEILKGCATRAFMFPFEGLNEIK